MRRCRRLAGRMKGRLRREGRRERGRRARRSDSLGTAWSEHYGLDETFPHQQLLGRTTEADNRRSLYFVNAAIKRVLQLNKDSLKVINAGLRVFGRVEAKFTQCRFRLSQDGAPLLMPYMNKSRSLRVSPEDMYKVLISTQGQGQNCPCSELSVADQLESIDTGSVAMWTEIDGHRMVMCTWRGKNTVSPYISKEQRIHMIRVLGYEATELEEEMTSRRKQKAAKDREENTPKGAPKELTTSQLSSEIDEALDKIEAQYHTVQTVPDTISHGVEDEPSKSSVD
uniref:Uncharacterized protein n=1 Tax=Plectus sambesii TaxID=2011161 RepID=A0A914WL40_9BILA